MAQCSSNIRARFTLHTESGDVPSAVCRNAVLLDRDGTIIEDKHYLADPREVKLLPGAVEGLRRLQSAGFLLLVLTNQSGVGRGYYSLETMHAVHARMVCLLEAQGVRLDGIYACPHTPEDGCSCRKPLPGLVEQAMREHRFSCAHAVMIGDKASDIEMGLRCGARTVLVRTGYGRQAEPDAGTRAHYTAEELNDAAGWILEHCEVDFSGGR